MITLQSVNKKAIKKMLFNDLVITVLILFIIMLLLPRFGNLDYNYLVKSTKAPYGLMFKTFLLQGKSPFNLLLETPKPLMAFIYYFLSEPLIYLFIISLILICFIYFVKTIELIGSTRFIGILTFLYVLFVLEDSYQNMLACYWIWLYIPLTIIALYYFFKKKFIKYGVFMTLSGLLRPESWFLALVILVYIFIKKYSKKYLFLIPFLAPLLWFGFDAIAFHNPFFSFDITARYRIVTGLPSVNFIQFFPTIIKDINQLTGPWILILGTIGALITLFKNQRDKLTHKQAKIKENYIVLFLIVLSPFIFYWLLSIKGNIFVMRRFFFLSIMFLIFFIFNLPNLFSIQPKYKTIFTFLLFILFVILNSPFKSLSVVFQNIRNEEMKIKTVESSLIHLTRLTDSLNQANKTPKSLIVPLRRKLMIGLALPIYQKNIESFREIAAYKKQLRDYTPGLVYFLNDDFAGIEYAFSFLKKPQKYTFTNEGVEFIPLLSEKQYTIYLLATINNANATVDKP